MHAPRFQWGGNLRPIGPLHAPNCLSPGADFDAASAAAYMLSTLKKEAAALALVWALE